MGWGPGGAGCARGERGDTGHGAVVPGHPGVRATRRVPLEPRRGAPLPPIPPANTPADPTPSLFLVLRGEGRVGRGAPGEDPSGLRDRNPRARRPRESARTRSARASFSRSSSICPTAQYRALPVSCSLVPARSSAEPARRGVRMRKRRHNPEGRRSPPLPGARARPHAPERCLAAPAPTQQARAPARARARAPAPALALGQGSRQAAAPPCSSSPLTWAPARAFGTSFISDDARASTDRKRQSAPV